MSEGESLEDIKAKLKPKKQSISADMLDTANSYDDKVAVIRLIVGEESGRVSNVFRAMMQSETTMSKRRIIALRSEIMADTQATDGEEKRTLLKR